MKSKRNMQNQQGSGGWVVKLGCCCVCLKTGVSSHLGVQLRNAIDPLSLDGRCAPGMEPGVLHCCALLSAALPSSCAPMQPLTSDAKDAALPCVTAHSALRAHDLRACLFAHLSLLHATPSAPTSCWLASMQHQLRRALNNLSVLLLL